MTIIIPRGGVPATIGCRDELNLLRRGRKHRRVKQWRSRRYPSAWAVFGLEGSRRKAWAKRIADKFMERVMAAGGDV